MRSSGQIPRDNPDSAPARNTDHQAQKIQRAHQCRRGMVSPCSAAVWAETQGHPGVGKNNHAFQLGSWTNQGTPVTVVSSHMLSLDQIFALSTRVTPEQIGRIGSTTIAVAPFFQRSCVVHVSPSEVTLLNSGSSVTLIADRKGRSLMKRLQMANCYKPSSRTRASHQSQVLVSPTRTSPSVGRTVPHNSSSATQSHVKSPRQILLQARLVPSSNVPLAMY